MKILLLSLLLITSIFSNDFESATQELVNSSTKEKFKIIEQLSETYSQDKRLILLFDALLDSKLFYKKSDQTLVFLLKKDEDNYYTETVISSQVLEVMNKSDFKKVKTNNRLRSVIRNKLSELSLILGDNTARFDAAKNISNNLTKESLFLIERHF